MAFPNSEDVGKATAAAIVLLTHRLDIHERKLQEIAHHLAALKAEKDPGRTADIDAESPPNLGAKAT